MNDLVLQELQLETGQRILEIEFGGGDLIHKIVATGLPSLTIGVERSPDAIRVCQQRFRHFIRQGSVELY